MSSFLCFLCHSTVTSDTYEEMREKYKEVVGVHLCPNSHLCHICCHVLNKLWLFRSVCLKRSLEYPVLFSEKGTLNLQRNYLEIHTICPQDICGQYHNRNINSKTYNIQFNYNQKEYDIDSYNQNNEYSNVVKNQYVALEGSEFDKYFQTPKTFDEVDGTMFDNGFLPDNIDTERFREFNNDVTHNLLQDHHYNNQHNMSPQVEHRVQDNGLKNTEHGFDVDTECQIHNADNDEEIENTYSESLHSDSASDCQDVGQNEVTILDTTVTENIEENDNQVIDERFEDYGSYLENSNNIHNATDDNTHINDDKVITTEETENNTDDQNENHTIEQKCVNFKEKTKVKKPKKGKKKFKRIILSIEQQKANLERKRKEKKYIEAEFKCYNCAVGFLFKDTYLTHMMRHEESNGEHVCGMCTLRFATLPWLRLHMASHELRQCRRCGTVVGRDLGTGGWRAHERICWRQGRGEGGACHLCGAVFRDPNGLQQHLKRYHKLTSSKNKTYSCNVCGEHFTDQAALRTHMIKHINRKFQCEKCDATFGSPYTLNQHVKRKHNDVAIESTLHYCVPCKVGFNSRKSLLAHRRNALAHRQTLFDCPICSRPCTSQRNLANHVEAIHNGRKIRATPRKDTSTVALCHLCGANFKGNNKLNRHLRQVCEKAKLEEEFSDLYDQQCLNPDRFSDT